MKRKICLLAILLGFCMTAFAKQYVTVTATRMISNNQIIYLTGDIPIGIESYYNAWTEYNGEYPTVGKILNLLAKNEFTVEQMSSASGADGNIINTYLLSKNSAPNENSIEVINNDDTEAVEVARYNLQGLPVNENERGVQIIVYSNYTTKTVIVQ